MSGSMAVVDNDFIGQIVDKLRGDGGKDRRQ